MRFFSPSSRQRQHQHQHQEVAAAKQVVLPAYHRSSYAPLAAASMADCLQQHACYQGVHDQALRQELAAHAVHIKALHALLPSNHACTAGGGRQGPGPDPVQAAPSEGQASSTQVAAVASASSHPAISAAAPHPLMVTGARSISSESGSGASAVTGKAYSSAASAPGPGHAAHAAIGAAAPVRTHEVLHGVSSAPALARSADSGACMHGGMVAHGGIQREGDSGGTGGSGAAGHAHAHAQQQDGTAGAHDNVGASVLEVLHGLKDVPPPPPPPPPRAAAALDVGAGMRDAAPKQAPALHGTSPFLGALAAVGHACMHAGTCACCTNAGAL